MKFTALVMTLTIVAANITSAAATVTIPIPRPPISGSPNTVDQICLNQALSIWHSKLKRGVDRKRAARQWADQIKQCVKR